MRQLTPEKHSIPVLMILTLFAMVGPVSIDIFTPSLPAITEFFGTNNVTAQWSVGIFMLGFSVSMLIVGPLADRFGRKNTLFAGYTLYLLATLVILNTESIHVFVGARFAQAVFGCFGTAVARMVARDFYSDKMEVKMLAYISGCLTIAPMVAPVAGGYIQQYAGWQYSFVAMMVMGMMAMSMLFIIPERHTPNHNATQGVFSGYAAILTDVRYMRFAIAAGAAFSGAFVFVAGGAFVFIGQLNVAPTTYGYMFAVAIAGYLLSATMGPTVTKNMSRSQSTMLAASLMLIGAIACLGSGILTAGTSVLGYVIGIVIYEMGLGFFMPLCQARSTEHMTENMGTAAGLLFFVEMLMATLISALVGLLPESGTLSLSAITLVAIGITTVCLLGVDRNQSKDTAQIA